LIHHEYAGLAGIEKNDGAASDYEISDQLTDFLEKTSVLRLAVKGTSSKVTFGQMSNSEMTFKNAIKYCAKQGGRLPTIRELAKLAVDYGARGIVETAFPNKSIKKSEVREEIAKMKTKGYQAIYTTYKEQGEVSEVRQTVIDFYYSEIGFEAKEMNVDNIWSITPNFDPDSARNDQYALYSRRGELLGRLTSYWDGGFWDGGYCAGIINRCNTAKVRCVKDN